jgi:threonine synthase
LDVHLDRVFVQVGGGAFAACLSDGLDDGASAGGLPPVPLHAVQAAGCAPLAGAWERASAVGTPAAHWNEVMRVWPDPRSIADGILDDETYDWIGVVEAMRRNGGSPVVAPESMIERAHAICRDASFDVSPTGTAGVAGLLAIRDRVGDDERVGVVMSGVTR